MQTELNCVSYLVMIFPFTLSYQNKCIVEHKYPHTGQIAKTYIIAKLKIKVKMSKFKVQIERYCSTEYTYEI
jgi:hypothetical protein